ncbi:carbohydrate kinase (thermoresistant glucokinase family) [Clavibacter michiganensis]|uniref:gluconokinase, GntK/IdnK-type n=1 Tax=Clavibacter michiganensis TaxID=28447 RepID=UPI001AE563EF|nr:gluconokinase, GntK/IdnK-type [Clavibacter michiganensis]MBP2458967.1 carbohydrate kinase (thermoresistant glucokinase family) [Clavibacter michiganensis]MDQ0411539.1 carbohydrate kinase (thermoresistant glucokinase family) [Clavibacter michiganensis]
MDGRTHTAREEFLTEPQGVIRIDAVRPFPPVIVMGVSGSGKSTVGEILAQDAGVPFIDGDDLHPEANRRKMAEGHALDDDDRRPWLERVGLALAGRPEGGPVVACSALKRSYRDILRAAAPDAVFVHLAGDHELLAERLGSREGHFMPSSLLASQLRTLEPLGDDEQGITLDITDDPVALADAAVRELLPGGRTASPGRVDDAPATATEPAAAVPEADVPALVREARSDADVPRAGADASADAPRHAAATPDDTAPAAAAGDGAPAAAVHEPIRVAIVGCGVIGTHHARVLAEHPEFRVAALVDVTAATADELADVVVDELRAERPLVFAHLGDMIRADAAELVVICTPSGLHIGLAEEALAAGLHVVIEKPLDVDLARGRRIAELAREAAGRGILSTVISQHRFNPSSVIVDRAVRSGRLGRLTTAVASAPWWRSQGFYDSGHWRGTWDLDGGGALMNQGVHTLDLLVSYLGRPVEVYAQTALLAHDGIEVEDVAVAVIRFASGALATLQATTAGYPGLDTRVQVQGTRGSAVIEAGSLTYFHAAPESGVPAQADARNDAELEIHAADLPRSPRLDNTYLEGHYRQYDDIADALRTGRPAGVTVDDAFLSLATVVSVYVSATLGTPVAFEDVVDGVHDGLRLRVGQSTPPAPGSPSPAGAPEASTGDPSVR